MKTLIRNRAKCLLCGEVLESTFPHDYKICYCGNLAVDGGLEYAKRNYREEGSYEELSEYEQE